MQTFKTIQSNFSGIKFSDNKLLEHQPCCTKPMVSKVNGYLVCKACGLVHGQIYDDSPRRTFNIEDIRNRKITEPVYSPIGPRTVIRGKKDSKGRLISAEFKYKFNRLGKIHRSLTSSYERNLWIALPKFQQVQEDLGLPETALKDAIRIYKEAVKKRLTMGRSINILMAASMYVALKIHSIPRVVEELETILNVKKKSIIKAYRLLILEVLPILNLRVGHIYPIQYTDKFGQDLNLPMKIRQDAVKILKKARSNGLLFEGKDPKGFAAAAIYIAANFHRIPRTQKRIAKIAHITVVTLRVRARELKKYSRLAKSRRSR